MKLMHSAWRDYRAMPSISYEAHDTNYNITSVLTDNCIVVHKQILPTGILYHGSDRIEICGAIMRQQFSYNLSVGLQSIMCRGVLCRRPLSALNRKFFLSGQACGFE